MSLSADSDGTVHRRIAVLAHIGQSNLGDELLVASVLQNFRRLQPGVDFCIFGMNPDDTRARHGVESFLVRPARPPAAEPEAPEPSGNGTPPGKRRGIPRRIRDRLAEAMRASRLELSFSRAASRQLRGADLAVVAGSSQFIEAYGGHWGFPWTLLRWTILARLNSVPFCYLSMGAEPIKGRISRWMIRNTAGLATRLSVRDPVSRERLQELGVRREIPLVPDLGLAFDVPEAESRRDPSQITVGINTIPYFHPDYWRASDPARYRAYLDALLEFSEEVLRRGHRLVIYGTHEWADRIATEDLCARIRDRLGDEVMKRVDAPASRTLDDLWRILDGLDYTVAARYHGVITALIANKPVIGMAYEHKTLDALDMMGVRSYGTDIPAATGAWLISTFDRLERNRDEVEASIRTGVTTARTAVRQQFEDVLSLASRSGGGTR